MMKHLDFNTVFQIARRDGNMKRPELLVNLHQAKHVPVDPRHALKMMMTLGDSVSREVTGKAIVIGFAETATAIGAVVAAAISNGGFYVHSSRERGLLSGSLLEFSEEHSHAVEQVLCVSKLAERVNSANSIVFVDDEITTGKTLLNAIDAMEGCSLLPSDINLYAASVINRSSSPQPHGDQNCFMRYLSLLESPDSVLKPNVESFRSAVPVRGQGFPRSILFANDSVRPGNPRIGVHGKRYYDDCNRLGSWVLEELRSEIANVRTINVVGTEECMLPAIACGCAIANRFPEIEVKCHATTRSPISVSAANGYPVRNGYLLRSTYDRSRITYLYNIAAYDLVILVTDAPSQACEAGIGDLAQVFYSTGTRHLSAVVI